MKLKARWHWLRNRPGSRGQGMVEFALVAPIFFMLVFGLFNFSWMIFQQQSVINAARSGARDAALLSPLFENGTSASCSSGYGEPAASEASPASVIEAAAQSGSGLVKINTSALCATSSSSTSMTSSATQSGTATVTVTASPSLNSAQTVTVTVSYVAHPLGPFFPATSVTLSSSSTETVQG